jgi:hypothetical protein
VNACLANGRKFGSEFIASRGGTLDLEGAAGVGRLDLVQSFFDEDRSLKSNATKTQMESGFKTGIGSQQKPSLSKDCINHRRASTGSKWMRNRI